MTDFFPAGPTVGSNAIGSFVIGVSPIGSISPFQWQDTVISQYGNSQRLLQLIENFSAYVDQTQNLDDFFDLMWNVDTAEGYGLDVWGRIVGVSRILQIPSTRYLGFKEQTGITVDPFDQSPFYDGAPLTDSYFLSDAAYRQLIIAKAASNICDGSIAAINQLLLMLFPGQGNAYVQEGMNPSFFGFQESTTASTFGQDAFYDDQELYVMTMTYVFEFQPTPVQLAIIQQSGVLPHPTGVTVNLKINV